MSDVGVPVALTASTLTAGETWTATARAWADSEGAWELQVTVICASTSQ